MIRVTDLPRAQDDCYPTNDASKHADEREAVAWIRREGTP